MTMLKIGLIALMGWGLTLPTAAQENIPELTVDPSAISNIFYAIQIDNREAVEDILENKPDAINERNERGYSPLMTACLLRHVDIAKLLIENKANVEETDEAGITLLYKMVVAGHKDIAELLLDSGASPEVKDQTGNPLLTASILNNKREMAELLLLKGADINAKNDNGDTALHLALKPALVDVLLLNGADIDARNNLGQTPLHLTCRKRGDLLGIADILITNGADVNAQDNEGRTPLHYAIQYKLKEYVILFLDQEPDIYIEDEDGLSPLTLSQKVGKRSISVRLEAHDRKLKRAEKLAELKKKLQNTPQY